MLDRFVERFKLTIGNNAYAGSLQLFLAEGAVVFKTVGISGAPDDFLTLGTEGLGLLTLSERVVKDDGVCPAGIFLPVGGLGYEPVGNVAFLLSLDVIADLMPFFQHLPGDITDQRA